MQGVMQRVAVLWVSAADLLVSALSAPGKQRARRCAARAARVESELECLQGKPALAFSFDNFRATTTQDYATCAAACVPLVRAVLHRLHSDAAFLNAMSGNVLNVNLPFGQPCGYYLSRMGTSCVMARFVDAPPQRRAKVMQTRGFEAGDAAVRVLESSSPTFQKCALKIHPRTGCKKLAG